MFKNPAYPLVKEVDEVTDVNKVAQMLSSGNWIAIGATTQGQIVFVMGRVA